jgi:Rrf2 family protein
MQIALGRKGDYSVRAMLDVARHHGQGRRKSREIAAAMDIPERYLPQILANLVRHGLLFAVAGPDGGYALRRDPAEISLLEVVEAAEGPVRSDQCALRGGPCDWENVCPLHHPWSAAQEALMEPLRGTNFRQLAEADAAIEAGTLTLSAGEAHPRPTARRGARSKRTG